MHLKTLPRLFILLAFGAMVSLGLINDAAAKKRTSAKKQTTVDTTPPSPQELQKHHTRAEKLLSYGSYGRAAKHYEVLVRHDAERYAYSYITLGKIYENQRKYARAVLCYYAYLAHGDHPESRNEAQKKLRQLRRQDWAKLHVDVPQGSFGSLRVNGYILKRSHDFAGIPLPRGHYDIAVELDDHEVDTYHITMRAEPIRLSAMPLKKTLYGHVEFASNVPKSTITLWQEQANGLHIIDKPVRFKAHSAKPLTLPTGTYLVEAIDPDHNRWVRRIKLERDEILNLNIAMSKALPNELRYKHVFDINGKELKPHTRAHSLRLNLGTKTLGTKTVHDSKDTAQTLAPARTHAPPNALEKPKAISNVSHLIHKDG